MKSPGSAAFSAAFPADPPGPCRRPGTSGPGPGGGAGGGLRILKAPAAPSHSPGRPDLYAFLRLGLAHPGLRHLRRRPAARLFCPHGTGRNSGHPSAGTVARSCISGLLAWAGGYGWVDQSIFPGNCKIFSEKNGKNPKKHLCNPEKIGYNRLYSYQPTPQPREETPWQIGTSPK